MDFGLSEEQRLLEDTVARFLEERLPVARVREVVESEDGVDADAWRGLAELGITGCLVPEAYGGAGLSLLDAAVIATALGHGAAPVPFLSSSVLSTLLLREAGTEALRDAWLPRLADGTARIAVAVSERIEARQDAALRYEGGRLSGTALFVLDGLGADGVLVPVGEDVLWVPARSAGFEAKPLPTIDRTRRVAELRFDAALPAEICPGGAHVLARVLDAARILDAADILGGCDRALALSVAYAADRKQFGRPIATFQAVKHLCAEMAAALEPARSLIWYAAHAWDALPEEAPLVATLCKAHLAEVGQELLRTAVQVHGGIGFTDECDLQLWFKRVGVSRQLLGGPAKLRDHAARLQGLVAEA